VWASDPPQAGEGGRLGWLGFDQGTQLLMEIRNMLAGGKHRLAGPPVSQQGAAPPGSEIEWLQTLRR
jgi:hypothetical protein